MGSKATTKIWQRPIRMLWQRQERMDSHKVYSRGWEEGDWEWYDREPTMYRERAV